MGNIINHYYNETGTWLIVSEDGEVLEKFRVKINAVARRKFWERLRMEKCYVKHKSEL